MLISNINKEQPSIHWDERLFRGTTHHITLSGTGYVHPIPSPHNGGEPSRPTPMFSLRLRRELPCVGPGKVFSQDLSSCAFPYAVLSSVITLVYETGN